VGVNDATPNRSDRCGRPSAHSGDGSMALLDSTRMRRWRGCTHRGAGRHFRGLPDQSRGTGSATHTGPLLAPRHVPPPDDPPSIPPLGGSSRPGSRSECARTRSWPTASRPLGEGRIRRGAARRPRPRPLARAMHEDDHPPGRPPACSPIMRAQRDIRQVAREVSPGVREAGSQNGGHAEASICLPTIRVSQGTERVRPRSHETNSMEPLEPVEGGLHRECLTVTRKDERRSFPS